MQKVCVCGHFGGNNNFLDGQTVKTKNIYKSLSERYDEKEIDKIDTYNWKKHPISFFGKCIKKMKNSENMIILPAHNGVKVFIPLFTLLKKIYHRKIIYVVIGGWLPDVLKNRKLLTRRIKRVDKILVETTNMKRKLNELGLNNVEIMVNFIDIVPIKLDELKYNYEKPYKLCTFSRVMKEKGIEDAIKIIKEINEEANEIVYSLDIYGPIDSKYIEEFEELEKEFPKYINYKGCVDSNKSVEVLKNYYILLFPTRFMTEGIPGTIIDSLFAGVPVVASKWENYMDILSENENCYLYDMNDIGKLKNILKYVEDTENVVKLKESTLKSSSKFNKNNAIKVLIKNIEDEEK